jgi:hypothetical protein
MPFFLEKKDIARMASCLNCKRPFNEADDRCAKCGAHIGFPNVRAAAAESNVLDKRYETAVDASRRQGNADSLKNFEEHMKKTSAVISVELGFLYSFLSDNKQLYSTYQRGITAQTRKAAETENDRHRHSVDGMLFGTYGRDIRYAALSLDGRGPSYGAYSLRLEEIAVKDRSSLLEENSYDFVEHHKLKKGRIPPGYRSVWQERHRLAVAKLAGKVSSNTIEKEYPHLLLPASPKRSSDEFIEVHIFGPIDISAVESVRGKSAQRNKAEKALVANVKVLLRKAGKAWVEE